MRHIKYTRGDTRPILFQLFDPGTGEPEDITGYSFLLTVDTLQNPPDATTQVVQLTGAIVTAVSGIFAFTPTALESDLLGAHYYDLQVTDDLGGIDTVEKGRISFRQDITK